MSEFPPPPPEESSDRRFEETLKNQPPPPPADDAQRQWEEMARTPEPPPPPPPAQASPPVAHQANPAFPFAPTAGSPMPPNPTAPRPTGPPSGPGAGPCGPIGYQNSAQGVYPSQAGPSHVTDFGGRSGIPGEDFFSKDETEIRRAHSNPPSPIVIVIAVAVALLIIAVAGVTFFKLAAPVPWDDSPHAESFAPQSPTDFKRAVYTILLMQMVEQATQPYLYMTGLRQDMPNSLAGMVDQGLIESRCAYDGWGRPMQFDPTSQVISSPGKNGKWGDADDLVRVMFSEPDVPEPYWADEGTFERRTQENHMSGLVQMLQTQSEISRSALMQADQFMEDRKRQEEDWGDGYDEDAVWGE